MRRWLLLAAVLFIPLATTAAPPRPALAYDFIKGINCSDQNYKNSTVCKDQPAKDSKGNILDPLTGPGGLLAKITNIVATVAGAAAVIILIISALKLITSGSDVSTGSRTDTDVEDARRAIANTVIGLVVIVLGRTIIVYILNRL